MHIRVRIEKGPGKGDAVELKQDSHPVLIGRSDTVDMAVPSSLISKEHCRMYVDAKNKLVWLKDLGSTNGTFLNSEQIDEVVIHPGDKIQMGDVLMVVEDATAVKYTSDLSGKILGGYRIDEKIGRGSMGTVYRANQLSLGREVALKVLDYNLSQDITFVKSFLNEARSAGKLNHPNVVQVHDVGEGDGYYFFSMEYVAGGSLKQMLEDKGRLSLNDGLLVLLGIAKALEFAEKNKVIHCDVKPDNIMLNKPDEAKLADLGIAKQTKGGSFEQNGKVFGSPDYVAPEQAKGDAIDNRVDIYSLGVTGYEILSGRVPFTGNSSKEIIKKHIYEKPKPLTELVSKLPEDIWTVISKMMAKTANDRFASGTELVEALAALVHRAESGFAAKPAAPGGKPSAALRRVSARRRRRRR